MAASIFDPQNFVDQRKPLLEASPLPAFCYTSDEWYRREVENVFMKEWLYLGRQCDPGILFERGRTVNR